MISYFDFQRLALSAADCKDVDEYIAEEGGSVDLCDADAVINALRYIYSVRTVSDVRAASGLSRAAFCRTYNVPIRSMQDWELGQRVPSEYSVRLLAYAVLSDILSGYAGT